MPDTCGEYTQFAQWWNNFQVVCVQLNKSTRVKKQYKYPKTIDADIFSINKE